MVPTRVFVLVLAAWLVACLCGCDLGRNPEKTVTVEIIGIRVDTDRKRVLETLKSMTEGSGHYVTSTSSGNSMTVKVSPVSDVQRFSKRINFGKVTEVEGRTVKVDFLLEPSK